MRSSLNSFIPRIDMSCEAPTGLMCGAPEPATLIVDVASSFWDLITFTGESENEWNVRIKNLIERVQHRDRFANIAKLLGDLLNTLKKFKCNFELAKLEVQRVDTILQSLTRSGDGLMTVEINANRRDGKDPIDLVPLENILSSMIATFTNFTKPNFLLYLMGGREILLRVQSLDDDLVRIFNNHLRDYGCAYSLYLPHAEVTLQYDVFGNLKVPSGTFFSQPTQHRIDYDTSIYDSASDYINSFAEELTYEVQQREKVSNMHLFYQVSLRQFLGTVFTTDVTGVRSGDFMRALKQALIAEQTGKKTAEQIQDLCVEVKLKLIHSAEKKTKNKDVIDFMDIARSLRCVHSHEKELYGIFSAMIKDGGSTLCLRVMPPPPLSSIVWSEDKREEKWKELIKSTKGFMSFVGPANTGKTTRLLSLVHDLEGDRDVLWFDLGNLDTHVLSRVSSQLFFSRNPGSADILEALKTYLGALKENSVVVFDNVGNMSADSAWQFYQVMELCKQFKQKLCFIVISRETVLQKLKVSGDFFTSASQHTGEVSVKITEVPSAIAVSPKTDSGRKKMTPSKTLPKFEFSLDVTVKHMRPPEAMKLARKLLPVEPRELCLAGRFLIGNMIFLAQNTDLRVIRSLGAIALKDVYKVSSFDEIRDPSSPYYETAYTDGQVIEGHVPPAERRARSLSLKTITKLHLEDNNMIAPDIIFNSGNMLVSPELTMDAIVTDHLLANMSADEATLANLLSPKIPPFDISLAWYITKSVFEENYVRWAVAWKGLVECGWIDFKPDLGYIVRFDATHAVLVPQKTSSDFPFTDVSQGLRDSIYESVSEEKEALPDDGSPKGKTMAESRTNKSYLEYWAKEAARINRESAHDYIALICFDRHEPHFKRLFTYILRFQAELRSAEKSNIKSELSNTNLQYVGRHLAGCMNRLLNYRVSARESVELTDAMMGVMKGSSKTLDFRVVAEHALQKLRSNESQHCLDALDAALNGYFAADGYFDRAFAIAARGYIRHRVGQHRDAATDYKRAIELYKMVLEQPPVAKDVNVELKEVEILAKMLQDGTVSDPGIGVSRIKDRKIAELYTVKTAAPKDKGCLIA